MLDKTQATHVLGLDLDSFSLKGVVLASVKGKPKLETSFDIPIKLPTEEKGNVKPLYTDEQKNHLESLMQKNLVVTSLNAEEVLVRPLELKLKKEKDIDQVLAFQAEPILPFPPENALLDKVILSQDKEGSKLTIFATRKDHLERHLNLWNTLGIQPEIVSADPLSLALFAKQFCGEKENPYSVLYLGISHALCIIIEKGKLIAAQHIPSGISNLIDGLAKEEGITPNETYHKLLDQSSINQKIQDHPAIKEEINSLRIAITRTIYALTKQVKGKEIGELFVTGPGAAIEGFAGELCRPLNKIMLPASIDHSFGMDERQLHQFALPIGETLSVLPKRLDQINFRQKEFVYPDPWKRLKKPIGIYLALCVATAIALTLFGKAYINYQEGEIKQKYNELLTVMNKPYTQFEREFASKVPSDKESSEIEPLANLTPQEIQARLKYLEKEIQATPQTYPLQPNVPLVSDVLAWLSTHPNFVGNTSKETDTSSSLQVESFNYTMVKRPEPGKKQEKYQVKVELEFSSPTPKMAREFHDALIAPNDIVDPKAEIKWNSNKDRYRTSFYLKDKTTYSSS